MGLSGVLLPATTVHRSIPSCVKVLSHTMHVGPIRPRRIHLNTHVTTVKTVNKCTSETQKLDTAAVQLGHHGSLESPRVYGSTIRALNKAAPQTILAEQREHVSLSILKSTMTTLVSVRLALSRGQRQIL